MIYLYFYINIYTYYNDIESQSVKSNTVHCDAFKAQHINNTCIQTVYDIHHSQRIFSIADSSRILPKKHSISFKIINVYTVCLNSRAEPSHCTHLRIVHTRQPHTFTTCTVHTPSICNWNLYLHLVKAWCTFMYVCINSITTARLTSLFMCCFCYLFCGINYSVTTQIAQWIMRCRREMSYRAVRCRLYH